MQQAQTKGFRGRAARIIAIGLVLWVFAITCPFYLLFYLEYNSTFVSAIRVLAIMYFIVIPVIAIILFAYDLFSFPGYRYFRIITQTWYLVLLVFATLSVLVGGITYGVLTQIYKLDPLGSAQL
jgi:hypothetical protein